LNKVDIMTFKANWHETAFPWTTWVLNLCEFMVSNQGSILIFVTLKTVAIYSGFICNQVSNKLSMCACPTWVVNWVDIRVQGVSMHELSHLDPICEHIHWVLCSFHYSNILMFLFKLLYLLFILVSISYVLIFNFEIIR
jgi:hypothetical protein